jgi:capsular polysaccharide transport system permease protein
MSPMDTAVSDIAKTRPRTAERLERLPRALALVRGHKLFVFVVAIPTILSTLYYAFIAHDVYVSESQFVVRNMQTQLSSGFGSFLQSTGLMASGGGDVHSVQAFIQSRDALRTLEDRFHLKQSYGSPEIDRISRFNGLGWDDSFENLLRYYQRFVVATDLDTTSSILTLSVRAFDADEAHQINEALLAMSEAFVNSLNERARRDLVKFAAADVEEAERAMKAAVSSLSNFRDTKSLYDPAKQSEIQLEQVGALQQDLITTRKQLSDLRAFARDNPQLPVLENRIKTLQAEMDAQMAKVAGGRASLSSKSPEYETIMLDRDFAAKRLDIALSALEQARANAMSQQLYIERVEEPGRPDVAIEPRRVRNVAATFLFSMILWGISSLLTTAVREHSE